MKIRTTLLCLFLTVYGAFAQKALLQSGPMLGYNEMREVMIWAQTTTPAAVKVGYWIDTIPSQLMFTNTVQTEAKTAFTAKLLANQVEPGQRYNYRLYINDQAVELDYPTTFQAQALWQYRTDPPPFTVAMGSCMYVNEPKYDRPGQGYGGNYEIFESIHQKRPDAMLWLGDNVYLREADWYTRTGIMHRYTDQRSIKELQPLLASTHHYAIWDDHDFGPNDSDRSFHLKDLTLEAFNLFWANPTYGVPGVEGITTFFKYNDMDFFLLDDRYNRSPNNRKTGEPTLLGKPQLEWLIDALVASRAPFKFVAIGGQVLNTAEVYETYAHHHGAEREYLLKRIEEEDLKGVIFITGDRHHTELSQYTNAAGNVVYDFTVSPLTSGAARNVTEVNAHRVEGTLVTQRNFGLLEVSGPRKARRLKLSIYDVSGKELWTRSVE